MSQRSSLYFLDVCLPNENEPNLSLQMGILRWSEKRNDRPEVYVHTYLMPQSLNRVRWTNVASMGIDKQLICDSVDLPNIDDMIKADFLKYKRVVCFNAQIEPFHRLTLQASEVISITSLWKEVFAKDEDALECTTLQSMLEYLGIQPQDNENTNYTPLLLQLHSMAALWYVLDGIKRNPEHRNLNFALQCAAIWPLPKKTGKWFENNPNSLSDLSEKQIKDFFSENLADYLNWHDLSMFAHDWILNRPKRLIYSDLVGVNEMAAYIFNKQLDFRIQLWMLIFYALYEHKINYSREIALKAGRLQDVSSAVRENFSTFIISHLDDFLSESQKFHLVSSLIEQCLEEKDKASFTHYNFDECKKAVPDKPLYYCQSLGPDHTNFKCFYEIRDAMQNIRYRCYTIYGQGEDRSLCIDFVNKALRSFMSEVKNPFSVFWITAELRIWIQFITGISWSDYTRPPKMGEDPVISEYRRNLAKVMTDANSKYVRKLYNNLVEAINSLNSSDNYDMPSKCFNFQGASIEIKACKRRKINFFKRLFSFK